MKVFGIDVSAWQGNFNFAKAKKEGVKFAILRGAYSTFKDVRFESYYKKAKAEKLNVGVYLYSRANSTKKAIKEAEYLYKKCLKGKKFELPIYFDIEDKIQKKLSKATNTAIVKAFCETLEKKGYYVGIYASKSFFDSHLNDKELQCYSHWVAQWGKSCTYKGKCLEMWQFGGEINFIRKNKVAGKTVDQDYMLTDLPKKIKEAGLNGYPKPKKEEDKKKDDKFKQYKVIVNVKPKSALRVREKATTGSKVITTLKNGKIVTILDESKGWGKIKVKVKDETKTGWICLKYTKKK